MSSFPHAHADPAPDPLTLPPTACVPHCCASTPTAARSTTKTACSPSAPARTACNAWSPRATGAHSQRLSRPAGHAPARPHHRARLRGHARAFPADRRHRLARGRAAPLAGELHLPARVALLRSGLRTRRGRRLHRRAAAQRRHHGAHLRHLASGLGGRADGRGRGARPAPHRRQGAAGSQLPRRRARRDHPVARRHRRPHPPLARPGPPGLRDHPAFRSQLQRGATARGGRTGGPIPRRVDPVARGREPRRDPLGARALSPGAQLPCGVRRLRPDARARRVCPLHPLRRRRPRPDA